MNVILSPLLQSTGRVVHGMSTRRGGVSAPPFGMNTSLSVGDDPGNVHRNRRLLLDAIGVHPECLALPLQIHSGTVLRADAPGTYPACDALITDRTDIALGISIADCTPILIVDVQRNAIAAVHAGWRGTVAEIACTAVAKMIGEYGCDPSAMRAFIGPCAGVCCYVVGEDVASHFAEHCLTREGTGVRVDLKEANRAQLLAAGVRSENIEVSPLCTITESDLLHSYRRDRERSGRMMAVIALRMP
jgi:polyphenol oxidase